MLRPKVWRLRLSKVEASRRRMISSRRGCCHFPGVDGEGEGRCVGVFGAEPDVGLVWGVAGEKPDAVVAVVVVVDICCGRAEEVVRVVDMLGPGCHRRCRRFGMC